MSDAPLDSLLQQPDLTVLDLWLAGASDAQLHRAAEWHRRHKAALLEYDPQEGWEVYRARNWSATMLVASTAAPGGAAKTLPWNDYWYVPDDERELLRRALHRRSREWASAFVPAAARVKLGHRRERDTAPFLFLMLDTLVRRHDLPVPEGDAFLHGWARASSGSDRYLPALLGPLLRSSHLRHRPDLPALIDSAVGAGEISRAAVVGAALEALASPQRPTAQRVLADLLAALALTPDELAGRLPLLQGSLATAHGSVTAVLLPLAVSMAMDAADLDQIAAVVAGRAEKRQRATLLALLQDPHLRTRLGDDAVLGSLDHLDACEDAALRERVARIRRTLAAAGRDTGASGLDAEVEATVAGPTQAYDGMWAPMVRERFPAAEPLRLPKQLDRDVLRQLLGRLWSADHYARTGLVDRTGHATLLECLVRISHADPAVVRTLLAPHGEDMSQGLHPVPVAIVCWLRGDLDEGPIYDEHIPGEFFMDPVPPWPWRPRAGVINAAAREALWRSGRVATVLSTPSLTDGTLHLEALLRRIESGRVPSYTPYDLAQTLLRLRPVSPEDRVRVDALGDLTLPADPACWAEHARTRGVPDAAPRDGVELIRDWVHEGGLRPLDARWRLTKGIGPNGIGWDWGDEPPLPTEVLRSLLVDGADLADASSMPTAITLVPCWPDLAAATLHPKDTGVRPDVLLEAPGPMGTPSYAAVLAPLGGPPDQQRLAVQGLLEVVRRGALSPPHLRCAVEILHHLGVLSLARVAQGLEQAFVGGGLADLWAVALDITAAASTSRPLPSGLPQLLRLLAAYLPAVPHRDLPVELKELATARGPSKSRAEARALMAVQQAS